MYNIHMMNKNHNVNHSISLIVARYRGEKTLRAFAAELSTKMLEPVSHQSIKNWEEGTIPSYYLILAIALHNDDWRRDFALEILAVLKAEQYERDLVDV